MSNFRFYKNKLVHCFYLYFLSIFENNNPNKIVKAIPVVMPTIGVFGLDVIRAAPTPMPIIAPRTKPFADMQSFLFFLGGILVAVPHNECFAGFSKILHQFDLIAEYQHFTFSARDKAILRYNLLYTFYFAPFLTTGRARCHSLCEESSVTERNSWC
ncbi:hypothetical protein HBA92_21225 [Ochrobactrum sp. MR28]|nr:hypothetical protein [Ochrobactrum sp. MR28]MBX8818793.1 hypothetical protein [Ochrobactrum sp. MR31]